MEFLTNAERDRQVDQKRAFEIRREDRKRYQRSIKSKMRLYVEPTCHHCGSTLTDTNKHLNIGGVALVCEHCSREYIFYSKTLQKKKRAREAHDSKKKKAGLCKKGHILKVFTSPGGYMATCERCSIVWVGNANTPHAALKKCMIQFGISAKDVQNL